MSVNPVTGHGRNQHLGLDDRPGPVDITRDSRKITHKREKDNPDTTAIGDKRVRRLSGIKDSSVDLDGLWNPAIDDIMDAWLTMARSYKYSPFGTGTGRELFSGEMLGASYRIRDRLRSRDSFFGERRGA